MIWAADPPCPPRPRDDARLPDINVKNVVLNVYIHDWSQMIMKDYERSERF